MEQFVQVQCAQCQQSKIADRDIVRHSYLLCEGGNDIMRPMNGATVHQPNGRLHRS